MEMSTLRVNVMTTQVADTPAEIVAPTAQVPAPVEPPEQAETIIAPSRGWQLINFRELWQFRELLFFLALRDVKVRYKQTFLGAAWAVLQPAMMMVVFTIFFGKIGNAVNGHNRRSRPATRSTMPCSLAPA